MAAMPFLCNGTMLFQGFASDNFQICKLSYPLYHFVPNSAWGMAQLSV